MPKLPKKLIEVALPLDDINFHCKNEKQPFTKRHPRSLHIWWSRKPIASARAVLFAQLVNDPGGHRGWGNSRGQTKSEAMAERERLFDIIRRLCQWENVNNLALLKEARDEILKSWHETQKINGQTINDDLPPFLDPFCGGGSIPLEAQRLGLTSHAADLNPIPVALSSILLERIIGFESTPAVSSQSGSISAYSHCHYQGLSADLKHYSTAIEERAMRTVGSAYPNTLSRDGSSTDSCETIGWIWARQVKCKNPACTACIPLLGSWALSTKKGNEAYLRPDLSRKDTPLFIVTEEPMDIEPVMTRSGAVCPHCSTRIPHAELRALGKSGKIYERMVAVVGKSRRGRAYITPSSLHVEAAASVSPGERPEEPISGNTRDFRTALYGMPRFGDLFTNRQLLFLNTLCKLVRELHAEVEADAKSAGRLSENACKQYADAICGLIGLTISRYAELSCNQCTWNRTNQNIRALFARQAIPMNWDFVEVNPFGPVASWRSTVDSIRDFLPSLPSRCPKGTARQDDLASQYLIADPGSWIISTDPPYYNNIGYSDLSDFFYVWMRRAVGWIWPDIFSTILTPKSEELIADSFRYGSESASHKQFMDNMRKALRNLSGLAHPAYPITIYYAFKQSDTKDAGTMSAGWEAFLQAVVDNGLRVTATWPMRTEREGRAVSLGTNALASSIVLACRPRPNSAEEITRRQFQRELNQQLPADLEEMIHGTEGVSPIAPVDLAQAAIGPGMAIFSQYKGVLEADGSPMSVHNALIMINKAIDEYFDAAEGSMDSLTRFCAQWVQQYGFKPGPYGEADGIARACGVSADSHTEAIDSGKGKVRLRPAKEYSREILPEMGRTSIWICLHAIAARLEKDGTESAGAYLAANPGAGSDIRSLAYRLYTICERAKLTDHARTYNNVVTSWDAICEASRAAGHVGEQKTIF